MVICNNNCRQVCYDVSHLDHRIEHIDQRMIQDSKDLTEQLFALLFGSVDRFNAGGMRLTLFKVYHLFFNIHQNITRSYL